MRLARARCARALTCALLLAAAAATPAATVGTAAAAESSQTVEQQVRQLRDDVDRVGRELAQGALAYEQAEAELTRLTQQQFAVRAEREALLDASGEARSALRGLARAAYKGGTPPVVAALLTGDPGALSDLAYVQRSVNRLATTRSDTTRVLAGQQAATTAALERSDELRRSALAQRQTLEAQRLALAARTTELTDELARAGARLVRVRAAEELAQLQARAVAARQAVERAAQLTAEATQRAAQLTAEAAGVPYVPGDTTSGGDCQEPGGRIEVNGFLSSGALCPLQTAAGHRLRTDAARAFDALNRARVAATGAPLCITDSYRDYAAQIDIFRRKPTLAATPGRSQHGWGLAVDLCGGVQSFGSEAHLWMQANGPGYGWIHPDWADTGGSKPEAWHWEYVGS